MHRNRRSQHPRRRNQVRLLGHRHNPSEKDLSEPRRQTRRQTDPHQSLGHRSNLHSNQKRKSEAKLDRRSHSIDDHAKQKSRRSNHECRNHHSPCGNHHSPYGNQHTPCGNQHHPLGDGHPRPSGRAKLDSAFPPPSTNPALPHPRHDRHHRLRPDRSPPRNPPRFKRLRRTLREQNPNPRR